MLRPGLENRGIPVSHLKGQESPNLLDDELLPVVQKQLDENSLRHWRNSRVTFSTIHGAKGREWANVYLVLQETSRVTEDEAESRRVPTCHPTLRSWSSTLPFLELTLGL